MGVKLDFGGDAGQLLKEIEKLKVANAKLEESIHKIGKASELTHKKAMSDTGTMSGMVGNWGASLTGVVTGYLSISTAASIARSAIAELNAERAKGHNETEKLEQKRRNLLQISENDFPQLIKKADDLAIKHGVSREVASDTLFSARSEGWENDVDSILELDPLLAAPSATMAAGKLRKTYGETKYTSGGIVAGAYTASKKSILNFDEIVGMLPQAAEGFAQTKDSGPEQSMATLGVFADSFNNPGERAKALAMRAGLHEFTKGLNFFDAMDKVQEATPAQRKKFLGNDAEVNAAFTTFTRDEDKIKAWAGEIKSSMVDPLGKGSDIKARIAEYKNIPMLVDLRKQKSAQAEEEAAAETEYSSVESRNTAFKSKISTALSKGKISGYDFWLANRQTEFQGNFGIDVEAQAQRQLDANGGVPWNQLSLVLKASQETLKEISTKLDVDTTPVQKGAKAGEQRNVHQESDAGAQ